MVVDYLNTQAFDDTIRTFDQTAQKYSDIKTDIANTTTMLLATWKGEGRKQFETDYQIIYRQLEDIDDILYELYNALIDAQADYMETDAEVAKQLTL